MKKIFAIALALVMVLSMASAFAMTCNGVYDWTCSTPSYDCGKASVEVIPYVKSNGCGTGVAYTPSTCAAAINGEKVFFVVKLTVEDDYSAEWAENASVEVKGTGFNAKWEDMTVGVTGLDDDTVYYLDAEGTWVEDDELDIADVMLTAVVKEAGKAKVCATLKSGKDAGEDGEFLTTNVADWTVVYNNKQDFLSFTDEDYSVTLRLDSDEQIKDAVIKVGENTYVVVAEDDGEYVLKTGERVGYGCAPYSYLKKVLDYFGLDFGTCVTKDAIEANFGWDDEQKACFSWSATAQAIVDAECVVAIPKTGDASVLAWLF